MKSNIIFSRSQSVKTSEYASRSNRRFTLKRLSPFLLLSLFLVCILFPYILITHGKDIEHAGLKLILLPFIIANVVYLDISLWNYLLGRRQVLIWVIESLFSAFIIYFLS